MGGKKPEITPERRALGETLARVRGWAGLQIAEVAKVVALNRNTVASWESGLSEPGLLAAMTMADRYGISLDALVGRAPLPLIRRPPENEP